MTRVCSMHGRDEIACSEGYYNLKEIIAWNESVPWSQFVVLIS